ncbi:hypothetical protein [Providencia hangzhouensis]|uniref:hypothetical protein n=1 Tax=Providencia hangzhouensis TaxID=3031799 RepID=UPI0034DCE30E
MMSNLLVAQQEEEIIRVTKPATTSPVSQKEQLAKSIQASLAEKTEQAEQKVALKCLKSCPGTAEFISKYAKYVRKTVSSK